MSGPPAGPSTAPSVKALGKVTIVGAGKAGLTVATALAGANVAMLTLICRDTERRAAIQSWIHGCRASGQVPAAASTTWQVRAAGHADCRDADTVLFATADRDLTDAALSWQQQQATGGQQVWLHLSGVSDPARLCVPGGARDLGSAHPLAALPDPLAIEKNPQGFPDVMQAIAPLNGAFFALAGSPAALARGDALAHSLGGYGRRVALEQRAGYHAAAAVVANDLVGLMAVGEALAVAAGLEAAEARRALLHLAQTSLGALGAIATAPGASLAHGLTGAVGRGDALTLAAHLEALAGNQDGLLAHAALSRILLELVQRAGLLDARAAADLAQVLKPAARQP